MSEVAKNTKSSAVIGACRFLLIQEGTKFYSSIFGRICSAVIDVRPPSSRPSSPPNDTLESTLTALEEPPVGTLVSCERESEVGFPVIQTSRWIDVVDSVTARSLNNLSVHRDSFSVAASTNGIEAGVSLSLMRVPIILAESLKMPRVDYCNLTSRQRNKPYRVVCWLLNFRSIFLQSYTSLLEYSVAENEVRFA